MKEFIYISLLSILLFSCQVEDFELNNLNGNRIDALGHGGMGISNLYPSNSAESILNCLYLGATGTEIDIQMTSDGVLVLFHDEELIYSSLSGYPAEKKSDNSIGFNISKLPKTTNEIGFLKFKLNQPTAEIISNPLVLKVSYYDLFKKESITYEEKIKLNWTEETNTEIKLDQEEKKLFGIAILNQSLKLMAEANDVKDRKTAKKVLKNGVKQIEQVFPSAKPREVNKLLKEVKKYIELFKQIEVNEDPKN